MLRIGTRVRHLPTDSKGTIVRFEDGEGEHLEEYVPGSWVIWRGDGTSFTECDGQPNEFTELYEGDQKEFIGPGSEEENGDGTLPSTLAQP